VEHRPLNILELADLTGLPARWLRDEADAGRLPCLRIGRLRRFSADAILRVLAARAATEGLSCGPTMQS
jgi:excisionase family DNA binding protein